MSDEIKEITPGELSAGDLPEPSAHVVAAPQSTPEPEPVKVIDAGKLTAARWPREVTTKDGRRTWKDRDNRFFDPSKHQMGDNGRPVVTERGYFARRKIGERIKEMFSGHKEQPKVLPGEGEGEGAKESHQKGLNTPNFEEGSSLELPKAAPGMEAGQSSAEAAAQQTVAMEEMVAVLIFGDEWQFLNAERQQLVKAWAKSYAKHGIKEMPLWMEIVAAHGVIVTTRINKPNTKKKLGGLKLWLSKKYLDAKHGRRPKTEPKAEPEQPLTPGDNLTFPDDEK